MTEPTVEATLRALPLRAAIAVAARCAAFALERVRAPALRSRGRAELADAVARCARLAEADDHGVDVEMHGTGGRAVDLAQARRTSPEAARLLDAIAGACYAAASYVDWVDFPERRDLLRDFVIGNAIRAVRGVDGADAGLASFCAQLERAAAAGGWRDDTPIAL